MRIDNFEMKGLRKVMKPAVMALLAVMAVMTGVMSCSDDDHTLQTGPAGRLEETEEGLSTVFHVTQEEEMLITGDVTFVLADPKAHVNYEFSGRITEDPEIDILGKRGALTCRIAIGRDRIRDGRYMLTLRQGTMESKLMRRVRFAGNIGTQEQYEPYTYALEGSGTEGDPYRISSQGDFLEFQYGLSEDESEGYGQHFLITRSLELPHRSQIIDGRVWTAVCFQGTLDGGGHTLRNLSYTGGGDAEKDSGIGLFKSLFNARVSNLKLSGAVVTNASGGVGLICGRASGTTTIEGVEAEGTIHATGDSIGGIAGSATGNLTLRDIRLNTLTVSGGNCTGLVLGAFHDGNLEVSGVSSPTHVFSAGGREFTGGVAGTITNAGTLTVKDVMLEHSVDAESSDVKVIYGGNHTGGIAGRITTQGEAVITGCSVKAPVAGNDFTGAVAGEAEFGGRTRVENTLLASVTTGKDYTGGFFGKLTVTGDELRFAGKNRYVVKQSAAAGIKGETHVGGLSGVLTMSGKRLTWGAGEVELAVNVSGNGGNVGGAVGLLDGTSDKDHLDFDVRGLRFSSPTMRVSGGGDGVGGVAGWSCNARVYGGLTFDLLKHVPKESELTDNCSVVVNGQSTVGGIAGVFLGGSLSGLSSGSVVTGTSATGRDHGVGGIVGFSTTGVKDCVFTGTVSGPERLGGIAGLVDVGNTVQNCLNYSDIQGGKYLGGIVGFVRTICYSPSHVRVCVNYGNLTDGMAVGGIVGREYNVNGDKVTPKYVSYIERCGNYGDINANGNGDYGVGGVVGDFGGYYAYLQQCSNHGKVSSQAVAKAIGGVAGTIGDGHNNETEVSECLNTGEVSCAQKSTKLGGVVGHFHEGRHTAGNCPLHDCVNTGPIPSDQKNDTGGIVGMVTTCTDTYRTFNRGKISHGNATIGTHNGGTIFSHDHNYYLEGTGKSWPSSTSVKEDDIMDFSVYKEFDFNKVWKMTGSGPMLDRIPF